MWQRLIQQKQQKGRGSFIGQILADFVLNNFVNAIFNAYICKRFAIKQIQITHSHKLNYMEIVELQSIEQEIEKTRNSLISDKLDMSFGEIMNMYQDEDIEITPEFQRLFRWTEYQKTRFIESLLLGIPIPPIFVAEDDTGKWELVDGLQRISTIFSFFGILKGGEFGIKKNNWALCEGDIIKSIAGKKKEDLPLKLQRTLKTAICRVEILRWNKDRNDLKYELFNRLNTGGEPATEQEIRNCIFRGKSSLFNDFLKKLSENGAFLTLIQPTDKQIEQLYLQELVLRFVALYYPIQGIDIAENISNYMTAYMRKAVADPTFPYEDAELLLNRVLNLLSNMGDNKVFRADRGPFSNNIYDIIMIGVAQNIVFYETHPLERLAEKIAELKTGDLLKTTTSNRLNSKVRTIKRLELANQIFSIE